MTKSYCLQRLEVLNWGGFSGFHRAEIHPQGTAVIGQTASGKTTLIDALMTLLAARPSYNLASTGGHESDRDLMGYIRGQSGSGEGDTARPGKTVSAVAAYFHNPAQAADTHVALGVIFWIDSTSNQAKDRHDLWLFGEDGSTLADWLRLFEQGGKRALKQYGKNRPDFLTYDSKSSYLSKIQQFFEVGDNAFRLLNRAVGLKQLNSIDEIFRELVLEDAALFAEAKRSIAQFDDLSDIRQTLETAKRQQKTLAPLLPLKDKWQQLDDTVREYGELTAHLPYWYARHGQALWQQALAQVAEETDAQQAREKHLMHSVQTLRRQWELARGQYEQQGGNRLALLKAHIERQQQENERLETAWQRYQWLSRQLSLPLADSADALLAQQRIARDQHEALLAEQHTRQQRFEENVAKKMQLEQEIENTQTQLRQAARQTSNIPPAFEQFRADLAAHLRCATEDLPYVAQLIEVKQEESLWRGAIERALGSHRLRLLVPHAQMQAALAWVNARHNRLHVRLYDEKAADTQDVQFFSDSFVHKLNIKAHPLGDALRALLAGLDRRCVADVQALRHTAYALTEQGMMSGKRGWFDKQDHKRLDDDWLTGFDNRDLLKQLTDTLHALQTQHQAVAPEYRRLQQALEDGRGQDAWFKEFCALDYAHIDWPSGQQALAQLQATYAQWHAPDSALAALQQQCEQYLAQIEAQERQLSGLRTQLGALQERARQYQDKAEAAGKKLQAIENAQEFFESALFARLDALCHAPAAADLGEIDEQEKSALYRFNQHKSEAEKARAETEKHILKHMHAAKQADTGALAETGVEMADLPDYLHRLQYLNEEDLPGKEKQFADYLTQSSTESLSQLMGHIKAHIDHIKDRIGGLNGILQHVDFAKDKYLQRKSGVAGAWDK